MLLNVLAVLRCRRYPMRCAAGLIAAAATIAQPVAAEALATSSAAPQIAPPNNAKPAPAPAKRGTTTEPRRRIAEEPQAAPPNSIAAPPNSIAAPPNSVPAPPRNSVETAVPNSLPHSAPAAVPNSAPPPTAIEPPAPPVPVETEVADLTSPTEGILTGIDLADRSLTIELLDRPAIVRFAFDESTTVTALDGNARQVVRSEGRALDGVRPVRLQWVPNPANQARRMILRITVLDR
jgi:hypothetical protein